MTDAEKKNVIFGNDIKEGKGAVIKRTFTINDFKYENDCLYINCSHLYTKLSDVNNTDEEPIWLIRNDSTRASDKIGIYGLRPLASYKKRANRATEIRR